LAAILIEQIFFKIKDIAQAMRHIQRHNHGLFAHLSCPDTGGGRYRGLAGSAFSSEKNDSHRSTPSMIR
jgi:hypothetical protein